MTLQNNGHYVQKLKTYFAFRCLRDAIKKVMVIFFCIQSLQSVRKFLLTIARLDFLCKGHFSKISKYSFSVAFVSVSRHSNFFLSLIKKNAENFSTKALAIKVVPFILWWSALAYERLITEVTGVSFWQLLTDCC